jgi:hypothetical protein
VNSELVPADELVVQPRDLQPGDEIVGIQKYGRSDVVAARSGRIVDVGVGEHRTGGECIQLRWRDNDPIGHESNWWNGQDYLDESLFHVRRKPQ